MSDVGLHSDTETLLRRAIDMVSGAKSMPLSSSVLVSRDEVLELLEEAVARLPAELREARHLLRDREEQLEKTRREAEEILEAARARAERMVQRTEIVREAERTAKRTLEEAREEARRLRHEAEDYCDQKLANFQVWLERTARAVQAGRERLQATPPPSEGRAAGSREDAAGEEQAAVEDAFFDQDRA
jgi:cell division septum initiation protein DivIVA